MAKKKTLRELIDEISLLKSELGVELIEKLLPLVGSDLTVAKVIFLVEMGNAAIKHLDVSSTEDLLRLSNTKNYESTANFKVGKESPSNPTKNVNKAANSGLSEWELFPKEHSQNGR